jgi:hypothetical protein
MQRACGPGKDGLLCYAAGMSSLQEHAAALASRHVIPARTGCHINVTLFSGNVVHVRPRPMKLLLPIGRTS